RTSLADEPVGSDCLELLERLPAARAVTQQAAGRRPEDVLEARLRRAAVGTAEDVALQVDERRGGSLARHRGSEPGGAQLLAARRRDAIRRPGVVQAYADLGF